MMPSIFLGIHVSRKGTRGGQVCCLHRRVLEITYFTSVHISLARPHSYGHDQMQCCHQGHEMLGREFGERGGCVLGGNSVFAEEYDYRFAEKEVWDINAYLRWSENPSEVPNSSWKESFSIKTFSLFLLINVVRPAKSSSCHVILLIMGPLPMDILCRTGVK